MPTKLSIKQQLQMYYGSGAVDRIIITL